MQRIRDRVLPAAAAAAPIKVTPAQAEAPIAAPVSDPGLPPRLRAVRSSGCFIRATTISGSAGRWERLADPNPREA